MKAIVYRIHLLEPALVTSLNGDPNSRGKWQEAVRDHDVIINLAGASIFSRWTQQQKIILRASRINTTKHLVEALPDDASHITFFSTSATNSPVMPFFFPEEGSASALAAAAAGALRSASSR